MESRPDPDALLHDLQRKEGGPKRGRLTLFFGMCPGVGKTYAMLQDAQERLLKEGLAVAVAVVETHGRADTEALTRGLMLLPPRTVEYKGTVLKEMDLEDVLLMRPDLVLVDELAHSNAPSSRHPKRYQDVLELLDNGINVHSTLNVQHLESCAQEVRGISGVEVRETLPDSILERADEIRLVDITPAELRRRLAEGKVYLGERAAKAADNFFQEANLVSLRELALRVMARQVDRGLRNGRGGAERVLVAVPPDSDAKRCIRRGRALAFGLAAPWAVVHVQTARPLSEEGRRRLDDSLALARELGAEVLLQPHSDLAEALAEAARKFRATQILLAQPRRGPLDRLGWRRSLPRHLQELSGAELHVLPPEKGGGGDWMDWVLGARSPRRDYGLAAGGVAALTLGGLVLGDAAGYWSVALFYLFGILVMGLYLRQGPALFAGLLSALAWDVLFIPPRFTLYVARTEDRLMLLLYLAVAVVSGQLTSRLRSEQLLRRAREEKAEALSRLLQALHSAPDLDAALHAAVEEARRLLGAELGFVLSQSAQALEASPHPASAYSPIEHGQGTAIWVQRNLRPAGRHTDTLPGSASLYLPMKTGASCQGVLGVRMEEGRDLGLEQRDVLATFAEQVGMLVERDRLRLREEESRLRQRSEELKKDLFNSVSHELRTPLTVIRGALQQLEPGGPSGSQLDEIREASERLGRLVANLLNSARLDAGQLKPNLEWGSVRDLVEGADALTAREHRGRQRLFSLSPGLPLLHADFGLSQQALACVLDNAFRYSPPDKPVRIMAAVEGGLLCLTVEDWGPGFPRSMVEEGIGRFRRGPDAPAGGAGLGLSIARGFLGAQGAVLTLSNRPEGGADVGIRFPLEAAPKA